MSDHIDKKFEELEKLRMEFVGKFKTISVKSYGAEKVIIIEQIGEIEREPTDRELVNIADGFAWNWGGKILSRDENPENKNRQWQIKVYVD